MYQYNHFEKEGLSFIQKVGIISFVIVYPLFVSMYTMLPPFIGLAGYILIINLEKEKAFAFAPLLYLLNLDLNLSLPLLLSVLVIILVYIFIYIPLKRLVRCKVCFLFALIVTMDFMYYLALFVYDFIFNVTTVLADMLLVYYIVIDILIGLVL